MTEKQKPSPQAMGRALVQKALEFGADLAGLASVADLLEGPSEQLFPRMKDHARDHFAQQITTGLPHGAVQWQQDEKSVLVFAVRHPEEEPAMDWWVGEINPPGNKRLAQIARDLKAYAAQAYPDISVFPKPYHVEKGGIYLKDAAVVAGLGCIGRNNLLVTPAFGPRIRLRAVGLSLELPSTGPIPFDPCRGCPAPCIANCPQDAFSQVIYTREETGLDRLPARDGSYYRKQCAVQMELDENTAPMESVPDISPEPMPVIRYCRSCEFGCRIGRGK